MSKIGGEEKNLKETLQENKKICSVGKKNHTDKREKL